MKFNSTLWKSLAACVLACQLAGCGGGGDEALFPVQANVSGLVGALELRDAGSAQQLKITGNGSFSFATQLPAGTAYDVSVVQQPPEQQCTAKGGAGTVHDAVVIEVTCETRRYPITVTVPALEGTVVLTSSLGESITVTAPGSYTFRNQVPRGQNYEVTAQAAAGSACSVSGGTGVAGGQTIAVEVRCSSASKSWTLSGTAQGLIGGAALLNSDGQMVVVIANGPFTFPKAVADGSAYSVVITEQSAGQTCSLDGASGVAHANVATIRLRCDAIPSGGPPPSAPGTPTGLTVAYDVKAYKFSWNAMPGATSYRLFEDPDGAGPAPEAQVASVAATQFTRFHTVLLHERLNAQYRLVACNASGCSAPTPALVPDLTRAIGYFKASNTGQIDAFGESVALSADGSTLAVGAASEASGARGINGDQSDNSAFQAGAVYVFVRVAGVWAQQAYVKASNTGPGYNFGASVALAADGNTLVVGSPGEASASTDPNDNSAERAGAVYVFVRTAGQWLQQSYLKAPHPAALAEFGREIALSGDATTLVVAAPTASVVAPPSDGAVYVYVRAGASWTLQFAVNPAAAGFGKSVAASADGNTVAVGASGDANPGAVFVFIRSGVAWTQQAFLKPSNIDSLDQFGHSVALSANGNTLAAGAIFEGSKSSGVNGDPSDNSLYGAGAAYVFQRAGSTWNQQAYLKASNPGREYSFGVSVSLSAAGDKLAVGSRGEASASVGINGDQTDTTARHSGAAYLFGMSGGVWSQQAYIKASNTGALDLFGAHALSLSGDGNTLAVGATAESSRATGIGGDQTDNSANLAGAVYLY